MNNQIDRFKIHLFVSAAFAILIVGAPCAPAQEADRIPVSLSDPSRPALLKADLVNGGITVKGSDGKEVIVEARARMRESAKAEPGMRRVPMSSTGLSVEEDNNEVSVSADSIHHAIDLSITVPRRTSLKLATVNEGDITISDVEGEFELNDINGAVTLNHVSGSAVVHAFNRRLLATFDRVNQKPMAFSSFNGDIDVTFPADLKANLSLRSDREDILSEFDIQVNSSATQPIVEDARGQGGKYRVKIDKTVHASINGGGPEIQFKNYNGKIFIRKAGGAH